MTITYIFFPGGFKKVEADKRWSEVASALHIGHVSGASPSFAGQLRDIFKRFLEPYVTAAAQVLNTIMLFGQSRRAESCSTGGPCRRRR